jgi:ABC-2 type transport system permease protein
MRFIRFSKGFFIAEIREFEVLFWSLVFPILLYFFLSSVFGGDGGSSSIGFKLAVVRHSSPALSSELITQTIDAISGDAGPFTLSHFQDLDEALTAMKQGKQDLVISGAEENYPSSQSIPVELHNISGRESSQVAANIMEIALDKANIEVARYTNPDFVAISSETIPVSITSTSKSVNYKDYIFPSVALMMMLSVALFNCPLSLSYYRSSGINKKLYTTPLRPHEYFGAHLVKLVLTIMISLILLYGMAWFIYKVRSGIFSLSFLLALGLAMITFVSFGLMISSFARKESSAGIFGQLFYQTMMFLGGFFFPVFGLPWGIRWLVYVLPSTYLVELLRRGMGIHTAPLSALSLIAVPLAWTALSVIVFSFNFRKVMAYE